MLAEWTVELGADDRQLEIPWSSEDGSARFLDLKRQPELLLEVREAGAYPELGEFLSWANSQESSLQTAKCDAWTTRQMDTEDEVFGEQCKFLSYVDLVFADPEARSTFANNEAFVQALTRLLRHAPEMASAAEFIVRRCLDRRDEAGANPQCFYVTFYLQGYGEDERQARSRWAIALKLVQHAITQHCARPARS